MVEETKSVHWQPFNGRGEQLSETLNLPSPPPWRNFDRPILDRDSDRWSELLKLVEKEKKIASAVKNSVCQKSLTMKPILKMLNFRKLSIW